MEEEGRKKPFFVFVRIVLYLASLALAGGLFFLGFLPAAKQTLSTPLARLTLGDLFFVLVWAAVIGLVALFAWAVMRD